MVTVMIVQNPSKQKKNLFDSNSLIKRVIRLKKKGQIYGVTQARIPLKIRA